MNFSLFSPLSLFREDFERIQKETVATELLWIGQRGSAAVCGEASSLGMEEEDEEEDGDEQLPHNKAKLNYGAKKRLFLLSQFKKVLWNKLASDDAIFPCTTISSGDVRSHRNHFCSYPM